jgi:selenocysteine lyase/cysteine desulfurase
MEDPLWLARRADFPVTENLVYLNHAAVAPLVKPAADAMAALAHDVCLYGSLHYQEWLEIYEGLRVSAARLLKATRDEIAIVKNTSEGIATVALGLDWRPGDRLVAFREEFPANYFPWVRLGARGVEITWRSITDELDSIEDACRGARLLAISFVNYLTGRRVDLNALGEICARQGVFLFVDAIQGLGVIPVDVGRARIHALSADGHKWLLGPEGCGILYVQKELQDRIEPMEFGWTNVAGYADYASRDMTLRPDAGRYECGTLNTIGCFGLRAAIDYLNDIGVERVGAEVLDRARQLAEGLEAAGCELIEPWNEQSGSGIVTFRKPGEDSRALSRRLRDAGIIVAPRQGWVRASPHFYISPKEIERVVGEVSSGPSR